MRILFYRRSFWGPASGGDQQLVNYANCLYNAGHEPLVVVKYPSGEEEENEYSIRLARCSIPVHVVTRHRLFRAVQAVRRVPLWFLKRFSKAYRDCRVPGLYRPDEGASKEAWKAYRTEVILNDKWHEETATNLTLRYFFRRLRPDVIHLIDLWQNLEPIHQAHAAGIPVLYQEIRAPRDTVKPDRPIGYDYDFTMDLWYQRLTELLPLCAGVAALSPRLAAMFRERMGYRGPVYVIPLAVEGPVCLPDRPRPAGGDVTFGFAARIEVLKGVFVLLDAWARVLQKYPQAALKMAGSGDDEKAAREHAASLGLDPPSVLTGVFPFQEKSGFMQRLDVMVLPSYTEGTPAGIIEAMAHGKAVVATNVGGIPDVVTPDCGILVPPNDADALAGALLRLAADPELRRQMGRAARARYERLFSPDVVLPTLLHAYGDVARRGGGPSRGLAHGPALHPWLDGKGPGVVPAKEPGAVPQ